MDVTQYDVRAIAGPRLIGYLLNSMLYGSLVVQVYFYYQAFPKDKRLIKYLIYGIFLLETVQTVMIFRDCFVAFTEGLVNPAQINNTELSWFDVGPLDGITGCIVQNFFAYRIYLLSNSKILPGMISIISFTQAIAAIVGGSIARTTPLTETYKVSTLPASIWLIGSAVCDVLIASCMTFYLCRCDSKVRQTRTLITKLVRMTIETGTITASIATLDVITFLMNKPKYLAESIAASMILAKLYSNTTLATLNSRRSLDYANDVSNSQRPLSAIDFGRTPECNLGIISILETDPVLSHSGEIGNKDTA